MAIADSVHHVSDASAPRPRPAEQPPSSPLPAPASTGPRPHAPHSSHDDASDHADSDDSDDDDEDSEPLLKYARLTANLPSVYRNAASTSAVLNTADKMILGTHEGNILSTTPGLHHLPICIAILPKLSHEPSSVKAFPQATIASSFTVPHSQLRPNASHHPSSLETLYIATSSIDGHVCVSSLHDPKDVMLRNFARPIQAVALSPDYASDRMYVSGGLAGKLILTTGGKPGVRADANTNSAAAAASGWLGSMVGTSNGTDRELHAGEGAIHAISWSLSGKYVAWVNETGIMIMRSALRLDRAESDMAWERFAFIEPPKRQAWQGMTGVWKPRMQWVDDRYLDTEDQAEVSPGIHSPTPRSPSKRPGTAASSSTAHVPRQGDVSRSIVEQLLVGWGDAVWVIDVRPGVSGASGPGARNKSLGQVTTSHWLTISDGIVSSLTLLTRRHLLAVVYRTREDDNTPSQNTDGERANGQRLRKGIRRRHNALPPDLRIIDLGVSPEQEVDIESLSSLSRYETLSAADYFLSTIYIPPIQLPIATQKSALGALGGGLWDVSIDAGLRAVHAGRQASRLLGSGASILSRTSNGDDRSSIASNPDATISITPRVRIANPALANPGLKVFFHSPYDCILAVKREKTDRLQWLLERKDYSTAWHLLQAHPEIAETAEDEEESRPTTPSQTSLADFLEDSSSSNGTIAGAQRNVAAADRERQRIGDLWVGQLVAGGQWEAAAKTAGMVLGNSKRWEHWIWVFAEAQKFDEITPEIPNKTVKLPSSVFEVVLAHYLQHDLARFEQLIETWDSTIYDTASVVKAVGAKLDSPSIEQYTPQWYLLSNTLAKLYIEDEQPREALFCYLRAKNVEGTLDLIRRYQLLSQIGDQVWRFVTVGIPDDQHSDSALSIEEKSDLSAEPIKLLANGALQNLISVESVVEQLQAQAPAASPYLFFYFGALWKGDVATASDAEATIATKTLASRRTKFERRSVADAAAASTRGMLLPYARLAVSLFAEYSRPLLTDLLRSSDDSGLPLTEVPGFYEHASAECEKRGYTQELVHLLSATGQTRRALHLIIDKIGDVKQAVDYAREVDDEGLWEDLLSYSMDKAVFVQGLLMQGGSVSETFNSEELVRRIPNGLEIPGLKEGLTVVIRDAEIQDSIAEGAARVSRAEVAARLDELVARRCRGVVFEVESTERERAATEDEEHDDTQTLRRAESAETIRQGSKAWSKACGMCSESLQDAGRGDEGQEHVAAGESLLAYQCGHMFHVNCVLDRMARPDSVEAIEKLQDFLSEQEHSEPLGGRGRTRTSEKTVRAQRIAEVLGSSGCTLCHGDDDIPHDSGL